MELTPFLSLTNDIIQMAIVIFGVAVVLYNVGSPSIKNRVTFSFSLLLSFIVIVYLTDLLVNRTAGILSADSWLRFQWIGIALLPAAQIHLANALLTTTYISSRRRNGLIVFCYSIGIIFISLVITTDIIVGQSVQTGLAPRLQQGRFFWVFALYYFITSVLSIYTVARAYQHCRTTQTKRRMLTILFSLIAAPISVFPYLVLVNRDAGSQSVLFWLFVILGNLIVGGLFGMLTLRLAYFGRASSDRVIRVRLYKYMARVPFAATCVLIAYVLVSRTSSWLGLPTETAVAFAVVGTVILVEWAIHVGKRPLEIFFQLDREPEIRNIQQLSDRIFTNSEISEYLEIILSATCDSLQTKTAFVASITPDGPQLEKVVGPLSGADELEQDEDWDELTKSTQNENLFKWHDFWIQSLYTRNGDGLVGILGFRARPDGVELSGEETAVFDQLIHQAASILEDRILQQEVFAAVAGLTPELSELQRRRSEAAFGGAPALISPVEKADRSVINDPNFPDMVRDALRDYYGGPRLAKSPLLNLKVVQAILKEEGGNPINALRSNLSEAIELQKPNEGERNLTRTEWVLYNILEMRFVQGLNVRDVARRLAMSESDLYRKQKIAIENVARTVSELEQQQ